MSLKFVCDTCGFSVEGWDDGNPYVEFPSGKRKYCYHPSMEEDMRVAAMEALEKAETRKEIKAFLTILPKMQMHLGNVPVCLCFDCGRITTFGSDKDKIMCAQCKSANVYDALKEIGAFLETHSGNAPDYLCLDCGHISKLDPNRDKMACRKCKSPNVHSAFGLAGIKCPKCKGKFSEGIHWAIS